MIKVLFGRSCHVIPYLIKMNGGSTMLRALHLTVSRLRTLFQYKRNNDSVAKEKQFFFKDQKRQIFRSTKHWPHKTEV